MTLRMLPRAAGRQSYLLPPQFFFWWGCQRLFNMSEAGSPAAKVLGQPRGAATEAKRKLAADEDDDDDEDDEDDEAGRSDMTPLLLLTAGYVMVIVGMYIQRCTSRVVNNVIHLHGLCSPRWWDFVDHADGCGVRIPPISQSTPKPPRHAPRVFRWPCILETRVI